MARGPDPQPIKMSRSVYRELKLIERRHRLSFALVIRARIIIRARNGQGTRRIARSLGISARSVRKWKQRFRENPCVKAMHDADRSGRPARIPIAARCSLIKLACQRPDGDTAPFSDIWTHANLAQALYHEIGQAISVSEVGRILRFENIRPHRVKQWLHCPDPNFLEKANKICDLYLTPPPGAAILCIDEKPMQALERKYPSRVGPNGILRREYEYIRHGTSCLLAAFNIRTGAVFGRVVPNRTAQATVEFMDQVAAKYRQREVYVVWDNLNTHYDGKDNRWTQFNARHGQRFRFVYTPIHASWMNQVECWFSILHRRVLRYGSFPSLLALCERVEGFINHWNTQECHPFRWTWRTDKLQNPKHA